MPHTSDMRAKNYVVLEKPTGVTPLELITSWKAANAIPNDFPVAFAGRLDPMASGKLLILLGEECKLQKKYTALDKEYEVEVLLGVGSDTGDALGIPVLANAPLVTREQVTAALGKEVGTHERAYPVFSSKTVNGKPLFMYALEGTLDTITIPKHFETLHAISLLDLGTLSVSEVKARVSAILAKAPTSDEPSKALGADFRIGTITPAWEKLYRGAPDRMFTLLRIRLQVGSGTYMRTLADRIAQSLGTRGIALSIHRTRIGSYAKLPFGLGYWRKEYR